MDGFSKTVCDMHNGDKLLWYVLGLKVRTRNKVPVDPWPEAEAIMLLIVACRNVFQYEELSVLHVCCEAVGCVAIHFRGRLNTTRIAGPADLLLSLLRMSTSVQCYASDHPDKKACQISIAVWDDIAAFEALANVAAWYTTIVQIERLFIRGFRPVLRRKLLESLSPESEVGVIDWTCPGMGAEPLRNKKKVSELSPNGQKVFS